MIHLYSDSICSQGGNMKSRGWTCIWNLIYIYERCFWFYNLLLINEHRSRLCCPKFADNNEAIRNGRTRYPVFWIRFFAKFAFGLFFFCLHIFVVRRLLLAGLWFFEKPQSRALRLIEDAWNQKYLYKKRRLAKVSKVFIL